MNNQTFFLIIIILILIFLLPQRQYIVRYTINNNPNDNINQENSSHVISEYLHETNCEEDFDTMGNQMSFLPQELNNPTRLDKVLSGSLVPDFEPNSQNINPDLNSYGYATNNDDNNNDFYSTRGYINPSNASEYANTIQYNLAHPYQTRYCE